MKHVKYWMVAVVCFLATPTLKAQQTYWSRVEQRESTLGVADVYLKFNTPDFQLKLVKASQTVAALRPNNEPYFDFTPGERLEIRDKDSLYHLGDINLRIKDANGVWKNYSTATSRAKVQALETSGNVLAAADLANTLPSDTPVSVKRFYELDNNQLVMRFEITNKQDVPVEIGALGVPMIFNNILEGKSLVETHAQNVFFDPYIGMDAGYLEVKRLSGKGPALLVLPKENMAFEAYRPLLDDPTPKSIVFEGFHEWMVHSKAYAENEWKGVEQWNTPTSLVLQPGESKNFALKFVLSEGIKNIQETLVKEEHPLAVGVPGYVLPKDVKGQLFIDYASEIASIKIEPKGALEIKEARTTSSGKKKYLVQGEKWGRAKLTITYENGVEQTINYKVIKPEAELVKDFGHFLTTEQWFDDPNDPFGRNPSAISYDYEKKEKVVQDGRVWISGLSDEGGAGSWLAAVMKQFVQPDKEEIQKIQGFVGETLWGGIQNNEGPEKYGVKKSLFYYEPDSLPKGTYSDTINYNTWAAWDHKHANDLGRSYNYPHVAAAYWVLYRLSRYHEGLVDNRSWDWYLENAYQTSVAMVEHAPYYAQFGQMEGSVFLFILEDLKNEGLTEMANDLEEQMKQRAIHWRALDYPFGSEMPWDSTGQEEVYMWSSYFGYDYKANVTLSAILAYMPTISHWAYNGNARRYWDFLYGGKAGKTSRVERQIHHYGSSLNAIPVLTHYRKNPDDLYLLKVGYGGLLGGISNITQDGFGPAAFHSYPSTLKIDGISGDYGSGFYGYAVNSSSYLVKDEDLGWLAFGGNLSQRGDEVVMEITTATKSRVFIAPKKLWLTLDAGSFNKVIYNEKTGEVTLTLESSTEHTPFAYLRVREGVELPFKKVRGAYQIKLGNKETVIKL
ncbi:DUF5695 domain-containing protein [Flagellimonas zhangzhouensis]|uniref:Glycoside hydrolase n=1 Tax=Flagellimonas zhangzhouensis TaxID=1073328 RepID=A0A1H2WK13_9FLAO|nr:DUF5695 domain-containing protein [Allomuricauda zhangzhouensis]SDQ22080.1 hypothetical protein SAMN05216294_0931 [Allomuricauda zhangzhouensis]SDW80867.1 hypothetical protein SAMN04487892_2309 [Allomuricauda zhangzhouensis]